MIGQIAIVILVLFSYPLQCHPCRASVRNIVSWIKTQRSGTSNYTPIEDDETVDGSSEVDVHHHDDSYHLLTTSIIIALSLLIAFKVESLEVMLAFVGSTGSTSISFILPGLFAYKLLTLQRVEAINPSFHERFYGIKSLDEDGSIKFNIRDNIIRLAAISLFFFGITVLVVCLGVNIIHFA